MKKIIGIFCLFTIFISCEKAKIDLPEATYLTHNLGPCYHHFAAEGDTYIIKDDSTYQAVAAQFNEASPNLTCGSTPPAAVDFSKYTLLGQYQEGGGCNIEFETKVYKNEVEKEYLHHVIITEEGNCDMLGANMNWVLVELPQGYDVTFSAESE